jgi:hypothetical protein
MSRDLYIKAVSSVQELSGRELMKTGQTTSFRTGDDGDLQEGRDVDFFTLDYTNPFGNTNRFTDELGGQTYANNIVIDWSTYEGSTVLGYYRSAALNTTYENQETYLTTLAPGGFTGWIISNINQLFNICLKRGFNSFNYPPFNFFTSGSIYSSTLISTTSTFVISCGPGSIIITTLTGFLRLIPCRTFTVTGTTLT